MNLPPGRLTDDMSPDPTSPSGAGPDPESAFAEWADWPQLRPIDEMLAREAAGQPLPPGLTQRVYDASVTHLPGSAVARRRSRSFWVEPLVQGRFATWGRLAMAASIAVAFMVSLQVMQFQPKAGMPTAAAVVLSPDEELVLFDLEAGVDRVLGLVSDSPLGEVENILLTRDMTFRDLTADLALLAADVEM
jgi:hypothetical protein